ncbi:cell surface protein SprA [Roseivirga thermotolerans]|uniref:T9SS outer membrane translocon Sov/SprA n=1 Tax=Roseivirga thermotolerans TaxID=1758176 RepID=UPI00273DB468|nr:cell surface protein SprA [Roseivirga thermotolerans]
MVQGLLAPKSVYAQRQDSTRSVQDTTRYTPSPYPLFRPRYPFGDPLYRRPLNSPLLFNNAGFYNRQYQVDTSKNIIVSEKLDNQFIRPPAYVPFNQALRKKIEQGNKEFLMERSKARDGESAVSNRGRLIPPIALNPFFDRLFGGDQILINTNGTVQLDFGGRFQRVDNPAIPIRQQRNGTFEFNQNIQMSLDGTIGTKLRMNANFDNNNSFDFENELKVDFSGLESDIVKSMEIGNVSLPIDNSLIAGAQNLFGFKTQLQFGRLYVTALAASQRGTSESIEIEGGVQRNEFQIRASDYDENRHFFLGHFFRNNFQNWLRSIPTVISGLQISRLEVYVLNRTNNTQTLRNFAAFMDLGEGDVIFQQGNSFVGNGNSGSPTSNAANNLFENLLANPNLRRPDQISSILEGQHGLEKGQDFERVTGARKLDPSEYYFNRELGFISLTRQLQNDEVLAVSFEYNYQGRRYKVGELTEDYQGRSEDDVIFLKLLRPSKINTRAPTWDLMMKNIYNLNAAGVDRQSFQLRVIYRDDNTGIDNPSLHEGQRTKDIPLIEIMGLDRLNQNGDPQKDGNFDYVEGVTINPERGYIIFPYLEPFGQRLESQFLDSEQFLKEKYVFDTLYRTTRADAQLVSRLNKYFIKGSLQSGSTNEINLNAFQVAEGSVVVTAGGTPLVEGTDYTVDYVQGKVTIINPLILNSGKKIRVSYEKADLFSFQARNLLGTRLDYVVNDKTNVGLTLLHLNERPQLTRVNIGNEPVSNTMVGLDFNYSANSRFLTRMVDALPFIDTKAPSKITLRGEFAQLFPGTSNEVDGTSTSYIDDFEATVTPFSLSNAQSWKLGSTPKTDDNKFDLSSQAGTRLGTNYRRAKIAWYTIDNVFYRSSGRNRPQNITPEDLQNHYVRSVGQTEVIKRDPQQIVVNEPSFDIAYYPAERGMYNYNPNLQRDGSLPEPEKNFGAIVRAITNEVDFDKTNIEYIEFWMMDPFINVSNNTPQNPRGLIDDGINPAKANTTGGKMFINLGSISEDLMRDERHAFEQGLPADGQITNDNVIVNEWGRVTNQPYLNPAFDNSQGARANQDVGLDGLKSSEEAEFFSDFLSSVNVDPSIRQALQNDPSGDNFQYYLSDELDAADVKILARYKNFNGMEGNSPVSTGNLNFTPSNSNLPDNEDLNRDNTLADLEEYYEYAIDIKPGQFQVGKNNIVDKVTNEVNGDQVSWYLFRIPVRKPDRVQGNINGFKSIRYIRTYLTEFSEPVVLRFVNFRMVGSQWRTFQESLYEKGLFEIPEPSDAKFTVGVVSIEENSQPADGRPPYVLPPGIRRDRDNTSTIERRRNEQSLQLQVENLRDRDARAVYKTVTQDMINYGRIKMFLHADSPDDLQPGEVTAFLRLGTDFTENYYEIEVPLTMTQPGELSPEQIWPEANEIDIAFDRLYEVKAARNRQNANLNLPFTQTVGKYNVTVVGRPDMSSVQTLMIGVRNPSSPDAEPKSFYLWANELRVTDFDSKSGWAANARLDAQLADLGNLSASFAHSSIGFGGISDKVSERNREKTTAYDISTSVALHKFFPEDWGLEIPAFFSVEHARSVPQFDPLDPDLPLEDVLDSFEEEQERDDYLNKVIDISKRRSFNFSNVRKRATGENRLNLPWAIENFSFTYAYNEITRSNINTALYDFRNYRGAVNYNYKPKALNIAPFQNVSLFDSKWLQLIKDFNFNPIPTSISINGDVNRSFLKTQLRNADLGTDGIDPYYEKSFTFDRTYAVNWDLAQRLTLDYTARVNAIIDEPEGDIDTEVKRDSVLTNFKKLGRIKNYTHNIRSTYTLPFDKLPATNWINSDLSYTTNFNWKAGAIGQRDTLGNLANNTREIGLSGKIDLVKLYNNIGVLRKINSPSRSRTRPTGRNATADTSARKSLADIPLTKGFLRTLMALRSINFSYSQGEGTVLPGYMPDVYLFGLDRDFENPGLGFILGSQDNDIRHVLASNNLYAPSEFLTNPFQQNRATQFSYEALVEPFQDFRVTLSGRKSFTENYQEIFRNDPDTDSFISINPNRTGTYGISFLMIKTAFDKDNADNSSPLFQNFEAYRSSIKQRLDGLNNNGEYGINSQEVVIPAFVAAYSGQSPDKTDTSPFPKWPIPNWSLQYNGLSKIPTINEVFSTVSISHAYSSKYDVSNFVNSPLYTSGLTLDNNLREAGLASELNENGDLVPVYLAQQVVLTERMAPFIGINLRTKSSWGFNLNYDRERNLALNLSNIQVTEMTNKAFRLTVNFARTGVQIPFRINGRKESLPNELRFNLTMNISDRKVVQRRIGEEPIITDGIRVFRLNPTVDYKISEALLVTFYFDKNINDPRVSTSFLNARTTFGGRIQFSLSQ